MGMLITSTVAGTNSRMEVRTEVCAAPCSDRFTVHRKWCSSLVRYAQNFACAGREAAGGGAPESSRPVSRTRKGLLKNL